MPTKLRVVKAMVFPVVMYGCENWTIKNAECWRIDAFALVLEKPFESPLDCKEIKPVNPKGNQTWIFIGRTDAEVDPPVLWPSDAKNWLIGKDPDAGKDRRQEEKGTSQNLWTWVSVSSGCWWWTGSLACCSPWSRRVWHDQANELNWLEVRLYLYKFPS